MASTQLTKTFASDTNRKTWTWSAWIKRSGLGGTQTLMTQVDGWNGNGNAGFYIVGDQLTSYNFTSSLNAGTDSYNRPSRYLRDVNGWYHIVVRLDTTQSTASDRCRWYVNGEQLTDFVYANYPSLNQDCNFNGGDPHGIGSHTVGAGSNFFDGIMSHVHFADGQSLEPTVFGEYDANGVWKINTSPSFTLGTHGFTILKDGNTVTDQSTNSNNWSVGGGTLTNTEDSPSNVFATLNPLDVNPSSAGDAFTEGNLKLVTNNNSNAAGTRSNIAVSSGKWYAEVKYTSATAWNGVAAMDVNFHTSSMGAGTISWYQGRTLYVDGSNTANWGSAVSAGDIVGIALDMDNSRVTISQGGQWWGGSSFNQAQPNTYQALTSGYDTWGFMCRSGSAASTSEWNFGNGYFGTTAVASAGTNASGIGIFEFDVPTGFTSLSTKGLNL